MNERRWSTVSGKRSPRWLEEGHFPSIGRGDMVELVRTERLVLRPLSVGDRDEYLRMHEASQEHFRPWLTTLNDPGTPTGRFERELARVQSEHPAGTGLRWVALFDGEMAAVVALSQIFCGSFQNAYAGWRVGVDHIGLGVATEAVRALLDLALAPEPTGLGLHRVQANVIPQNVASRRVA
ncbi:MAG: N-acetyltransferase [Gemmatimonadetes bacterium]|nr:N-acetyltransferase [Gemmatimonadota bacterium]